MKKRYLIILLMSLLMILANCQKKTHFNRKEIINNLTDKKAKIWDLHENCFYKKNPKYSFPAHGVYFDTKMRYFSFRFGRDSFKLNKSIDIVNANEWNIVEDKIIECNSTLFEIVMLTEDTLILNNIKYNDTSFYSKHLNDKAGESLLRMIPYLK